MITLIKTLPDIPINSVESFKIKSDYEIYRDTTNIYTNEEGGLISLSLGGGCVILGKFKRAELISFLNFTSPYSIFCGGKTAEQIKTLGYNETSVTVLKALGGGVKYHSDDLTSDKAYSILKNAKNFILPPYEHFAVDYCRRKNKGALKVKTVEDAAAAIAFTCRSAALICGVVSLKKGCGSRVLKGLLADLSGKTVFAAAEKENIPFYTKNGFEPLYKAAYLIKP